jgi:hypothetical protein
MPTTGGWRLSRSAAPRRAAGLPPVRGLPVRERSPDVFFFPPAISTPSCVGRVTPRQFAPRGVSIPDSLIRPNCPAVAPQSRPHARRFEGRSVSSITVSRREAILARRTPLRIRTLATRRGNHRTLARDHHDVRAGTPELYFDSPLHLSQDYSDLYAEPAPSALRSAGPMPPEALGVRRGRSSRGPLDLVEKMEVGLVQNASSLHRLL